jgi:two-component system invasion response regulator UvrY
MINVLLADDHAILREGSMPGRSGLDVLGELKMLRPRRPVLVFSMHPEDQYGKRVLKAGAVGYLRKESAPEELIKAIRKVLAGGRYVSSALAEKLVLDLDEDANRPIHETLSAREFQILVMIGSGKTVSQIAEDLHLSVVDDDEAVRGVHWQPRPIGRIRGRHLRVRRIVSRFGSRARYGLYCD